MEIFTPSSVRRISNEIGAFYQLPDQVIARGVTTEVVIADAKHAALEMGRYCDTIRRFAQNSLFPKHPLQEILEGQGLPILPLSEEFGGEKHMDNELKTLAACFIPEESGGRKIIVLEDVIREDRQLVYYERMLKHELVHAMAFTRLTERSGFSIWLTSGGRLLNRFDEASTEMLGLACGLKTSIEDIFGFRIPHPMLPNFLFSLVESPYSKSLMRLMVLLKEGYGLKTPDNRFGFRDMSRYYFGLLGPENGPVEFFELLIKDLGKEDQARISDHFLSNFLLDFIFDPEGKAN